MKKIILIILLPIFLTSCRATRITWQYSYKEEISKYAQNKDKIILIGKRDRYEFDSVTNDETKLLSQKQKLPNNVALQGKVKLYENNKIMLNIGFVTKRILPSKELEVVIKELNKIKTLDAIKNHNIYGKRYAGFYNDSETNLIEKPYNLCVEYPKSFIGIATRVILTPFTAIIDIYANIGALLDIPNWRENFTESDIVFFRPPLCGLSFIRE